MSPQKKNPGWQAGVQELLVNVHHRHALCTASERRAQIIGRRFYVPYSLARTIAHLAFGEGRDDE